ncbi:MAG: hypothetical protein Unbinned2902contig1001_35 [Prokaryotic dsDNA virus sp.]|nr:MAG: hypothetical protein Unbinned2902contig1001_35 [Prokaryotic dsDNA virus sp.]|tara:strand:+ start:25069 stop:25326 length:258 start_codon:yes stop_codon:yes gene_type:complete
MRRIYFSEEDFVALKKYFDLTKHIYHKSYIESVISLKDYQRMDKIINRVHKTKKLRERYDKTKTEGFNNFIIKEKLHGSKTKNDS